ncbi:MAG: hypothetical protein ACXVPY_07945, partial [Bacteroidia bacterium]
MIVSGIRYHIFRSFSIFAGSIFFIFLLLAASCSQKQQVDLIVHNAVIYTVDSSFSNAESFAVKDGKFVEVGTNDEILNKYSAKEIIDAQGKT